MNVVTKVLECRMSTHEKVIICTLYTTLTYIGLHWFIQEFSKFLDYCNFGLRVAALRDRDSTYS